LDVANVRQHQALAIMSKRTKFVLASVATLIVLIAVVVGVVSGRDRSLEVRTEVVARRDLISTVTASGFIQPKRKVDISADISGRVTELFVEEGQWVEAGNLLLRIDPTSFQANVRRATAAVAQARAQAAQSRANVLRAEGDLARAEQLLPQNLIAPAEVEQARTQLMVAQAQMEAAEHGVSQADASLAEAGEQLRKTTIAAPMSGHVTRLNIRPGETAIVGTMNNAGSLLLTIADLSEMEARVRVGETDIPAIQVGDSANVRIDAYPDVSFAGHVTRIANSAVNAPATRGQTTAPSQQAQTIDFEVIVTLTRPPQELRPDLTATAEVITDTRKQALAVPIIAVTVRDGEGKRFASEAGNSTANADEVPEVEGVFILRDGTAEWTPVKVGIVGELFFEVLEGLEGGEEVISGPYATIRDLEAGARVRVTENPSETAGE
jgi:HlyD family secretion protein